MEIKIDQTFPEDFPQTFQVSFVMFDKKNSVEFIKLDNRDDSYLINGSNIYVIDISTGNPVQFNSNNQEVLEFV